MQIKKGKFKRKMSVGDSSSIAKIHDRLMPKL